MDSRELYPSDEQRRRIMDFIMAAGETLLENGAEVFRVEQTMEIMARSFHLREFHVYVLTNGIFASAERIVPPKMSAKQAVPLIPARSWVLPLGKGMRRASARQCSASSSVTPPAAISRERAFTAATRPK